MGKSYINRDSKQAIYSLYGIKFFFEALLEHAVLPEQKAIKRSIQAAYNQTSKIVDYVMDQLDVDTAKGLWRFTRDMELICMHKCDPRAEGEYLMVKGEEALRVLASNHECLFCEKTGKAAEKCDLRAIAHKWQLIPLGNGECPFRREY